MPVYSHQIISSKHKTFLKEERSDPITGEALKSGDQIVFCAGCKSAFLLDSWNYIKGKHCEQANTLKTFPKPRALNISRELGGLLYGHEVNEYSIFKRVSTIFLIIITHLPIFLGAVSLNLLLLVYSIMTFLEQPITNSILFLVHSTIWLGLYTGAKFIFRQNIFPTKFKIYKNGFELRSHSGTRQIYLSEIKQVHFHGKRELSDPNELWIHTNTLKPIVLKIPGETEWSRMFFYTLGDLSKRVRVTFSVIYTGQQEDLERLARDYDFQLEDIFEGH